MLNHSALGWSAEQERINRYQVFRYPNRLQLEFQLPEPAEHFRWRTGEAEKQANLQAPPAWNVKLEDIQNADSAISLANRYRAACLSVLPAQNLSVVQVLQGTPEETPNDGSVHVQWGLQRS